jgi:hypothetical protein
MCGDIRRVKVENGMEIEDKENLAETGKVLRANFE